MHSSAVTLPPKDAESVPSPVEVSSTSRSVVLAAVAARIVALVDVRAPLPWTDLETQAGCVIVCPSDAGLFVAGRSQVRRRDNPRPNALPLHPERMRSGSVVLRPPQ
jgi:hypothetical protein